VSVKMHLAAMIVRVWRCTWRAGLYRFGNALERRHDVNLEAVIVRVARYAWRLSIKRVQ
jgi:hypothetical protein